MFFIHTILYVDLNLFGS